MRTNIAFDTFPRPQIALLWWRVRVLAVLAVLPLGLRLASTTRVVAALTPRALGPERPYLLASTVQWVDRVVDLRPFRYWGHCLRRSLTLYYAATRMGYPVRIAVGVRREGAGLSGHGWLELDGLPFLERGDPPESVFTVVTHLPYDSRRAT